MKIDAKVVKIFDNGNVKAVCCVTPKADPKIGSALVKNHYAAL